MIVWQRMRIMTWFSDSLALTIPYSAKSRSLLQHQNVQQKKTYTSFMSVYIFFFVQTIKLKIHWFIDIRLILSHVLRTTMNVIRKL